MIWWGINEATKGVKNGGGFSDITSQASASISWTRELREWGRLHLLSPFALHTMTIPSAYFRPLLFCLPCAESVYRRCPRIVFNTSLGAFPIFFSAFPMQNLDLLDLSVPSVTFFNPLLRSLSMCVFACKYTSPYGVLHRLHTSYLGTRPCCDGITLV
jgi:hypothetical protein